MAWADEEQNALPARVESSPDKDGIRTIIEYKMENGIKMKITSKVKSSSTITKCSKAVMRRKSWEKFGKGITENMNVTYTSNEDITVEDPNSDIVQPGEKKEEDNIFAGVKNSSIVVCRHCGMVGDHWTLKCPYKDTPADQIAEAIMNKKSSDANAAPAPSAAASTTGKYVPPSQRAGAVPSSESQSIDERDNATLRVTNISTDTRDGDLQDLFRTFGPVSRIYLAKDRETLASRGFAFISFVYREDAERAMNALQGFGYDHLILKLEWAKPSVPKAAVDEGSIGTTFRSGYGKALPQTVGATRK